MSMSLHLPVFSPTTRTGATVQGVHVSLDTLQAPLEQGCNAEIKSPVSSSSALSVPWKLVTAGG